MWILAFAGMTLFPPTEIKKEKMNGSSLQRLGIFLRATAEAAIEGYHGDW